MSLFRIAKDLIQGLLKTDPRERYTVEMVINNPWIKVCSICRIIDVERKII